MNAIRMHTEQTADPDAFDWVVRDDLVTGAMSFEPNDPADLTQLPAELAALLNDGTLTRIVVQDGRITVWRAPAREWPDIAPRVQAAILAELSDVGGIHVARKEGLSDGLLASGVQRILDNEIGELVASHGGFIRLVGVSDGVVSLRLAGACKGCSSSELTLKAGIESQLRRRFADLKRVDAVSDELPETDSGIGGRRSLPVITTQAPGPCPLDDDGKR